MAFASSRLALIVTGYLALTLFPAHPVESWQGLAFPGNNWIDGWVRWDSFWYESIVDPHPRFIPAYLSNANFFPFYSWVSWIVALPIRAFLDLEHAFFIGGLIVSSVSFLLGLAAVDRLTTKLAGPDVSTRAMWLIAVFPFSFFLTAVYADALYFCLCAWSLTFAYERRWPLACALAAMASMTRIPGLALFPALASSICGRMIFDSSRCARRRSTSRFSRSVRSSSAVISIGATATRSRFFTRASLDGIALSGSPAGRATMATFSNRRSSRAAAWPIASGNSRRRAR